MALMRRRYSWAQLLKTGTALTHDKFVVVRRPLLYAGVVHEVGAVAPGHMHGRRLRQLYNSRLLEFTQPVGPTRHQGAVAIAVTKVVAAKPEDDATFLPPIEVELDSDLDFNDPIDPSDRDDEEDEEDDDEDEDSIEAELESTPAALVPTKPAPAYVPRNQRKQNKGKGK